MVYNRVSLGVNIINKNNTIALALAGLLAVSAFVIGSLYTRVQYLENGTSTVAKAAEAGNVAGDVSQPDATIVDNLPELTDEDHVKGDRNARILLVEYSDLECPFCQQFHQTAQQVVDDYDGQVAWAYRHFPLEFHQNAQKEAEASECAAELGGNDAFWKYIDKIFERTTTNGTGFALDKLVPLAQEIGIDGNDFRECLDSDRHKQNVLDQMAGGKGAGITGTPGNILLDTKTGETRLIPGAVPYEQIKPVIDELLQG
ncbi:disulfide bond formation protein DsbA [Candidatus Roizmanbacteria bacterium CG22_combo_CG10-13_8_21_14_all_38_20]|uniref:Disulfide bond formation protein DsbA n=1 Tax=Candidatus Roizmanbacteria bacterium CG22_combo_CG10-13_8_21_14_all_38_20 TaxID=1974862 RepID=A0A2H0BUZ7_9BACT|nr:thioredoxin domain-containing protein [Candidatus Microgenomates bacterium]PIP61495.1 MAG: disulfide bond formation protein DsbA [Candidatus Roizmanbacteria bacterium CG22_combo_CG10-13_8_21_14_all_38_20]PJC32261.1 MAG: disulfide bond formation protein DsbA [Candidatus Roizmanbacteria bacterium CG_4_9_14_0_2_um_filter_38_17]